MSSASHIHLRTLSNYESRCTVRLLFLFRPREPWVLTSCPADGLSSLDTLLEALDNLDAVCDSVEEKYLSSLQDGHYERWEEKS